MQVLSPLESPLPCHLLHSDFCSLTDSTIGLTKGIVLPFNLCNYMIFHHNVLSKIKSVGGFISSRNMMPTSPIHLPFSWL